MLTLILAYLTSCGYLILDRVLVTTERPTRICGGAAVGLCLFVQMVNLGERLGVPAPVAPPLSLALLGAIAALCRLRRPRSQHVELTRNLEISLWVLVALTYFVVAAAHNRSGDDDFWIHGPLQSLLQRNGLPVIHPYFSEIEMNGHYGRDLLIAGLGTVSGSNMVWVEGNLCPILQGIGLALLWLLPWRLHRSAWMAFLVSLQVFVGINVGGRMGQLDCFQNNNPLVYVTCFLSVLLLLEALQRGGKAILGLSGTILGLLSIVYETHFGLVGLSLFATTIFLHLRGDTARPILWQRFAVVVAIALGLAACQGGPLTHLLESKLGLIATPARPLTPGEMNQRQVIPLHFPKADLFQIHLAYGRYQQISQGFVTFFGAEPTWLRQVKPAYYFIWSWEVLRIHWLVTWLAPLALIVVWRRRCAMGFFFWIFAASSFLIPALVDFGPIYEFEYYRWQYAAGVGFAALTGAALGLLLESAARPWRWTPFLVLWAVLNVAPFYFSFLRPTAQFAFTSSGWTPWPTGKYLGWTCNPAGLVTADVESAAWLHPRSRPGERALMNFPAWGNNAILVESAFVTLSGVPCVGHAYPLTAEAVGTPPYHMAPCTRQFWADPDPEILNQLLVDFVLFRKGPDEKPNALERLENLKGLSKIYDEGYAIFRFDRESYKTTSQPAGDDLVLNLTTTLPEKLQTGAAYTNATLEWNSSSPQDRYCYYSFVAEGEDNAPAEPLGVVAVTLPAGSRTRPLALVMPLEKGHGHLRWWTAEKAGAPLRPLKSQPQPTLTVSPEP